MPERPDLDYQAPLLRDALLGRCITAAEVLDPVVLRMLIQGDPRQILPGRPLLSVHRRSAFLVFTLGGAGSSPRATMGAEAELELAVHCMLAGRFSILKAGSKTTKDTAFVLDLDDGTSLRYRDSREMGKVYLLRPADEEKVPGLLAQGLDVLDPSFTLDVFGALAKRRRDQVKVFLMDKDALDSMGNAYADEVMWAARVHPKARVHELDAAATAGLYTAIVSTLSAARDEIAARKTALDDKVRDFLSVRNRKGEPCPRCGDPVGVVGVLGHDAIFCATCQPDRQGRGLIDGPS